MNGYDIIIIGAGAAGLACADKLLRAGKKVMVLEARARVGGRAHTLTHLDHPVELGAEFIHAADPGLLDELKKAEMTFVDVGNNRFASRNGRLVLQEDFWDDIKKITGRLRADRKEDRSLADFLKAHQKSIKPRLRPLLRGYLEGFHAADLNLLGEKALAEIEKDEAATINGVEMFRPVGGYKRLMDYWLRAHGDASHWLQLESPVQRVSWKKNAVVVEGKPFSTLRARMVIITVSAGVLKSDNPLFTFEIDPLPQAAQEALATIHMGDVERLTFEFHSRFWEDLTDKPLGFIQASPEDYFSTWWTQWPSRTPFLTAWQGGPKAYEIGHWPMEKQVNVALTTLAKITGRSVRSLRALMKSYHIHNWASDPYSQGAYSYFGLNAAEKIKPLRRPFEDTLIFAGEATAEKSALATVHGAMHSGWRAAEQALTILDRKR